MKYQCVKVWCWYIIFASNASPTVSYKLLALCVINSIQTLRSALLQRKHWDLMIPIVHVLQINTCLNQNGLLLCLIAFRPQFNIRDIYRLSAGEFKTFIWPIKEHLKGTYYAKITFIRCLNTVVWPQCENNQPIMLKIHQLIFLWNQ